MADNKDYEIGQNTSSGAEKVETVEKEVKTKTNAKKSTRSTSNPKRASVKSQEKIDVKKMNAASTNGKAEKESKAAKARVAAALKKKEAKMRRMEEKLNVK